MMDGIRQWLLGILAAAMGLSLLYALLPKGAVRAAAKATGGLILLLAVLGGGAFAYVKFIKPNRSGVKVSADPDEYDFPDEEYINEDEPAEAETEAEHE
mgnify:CR=1 FL=1